MKRRDLLRTTGTSITAASFVGVAAAGSSDDSGRSFEDHADQARMIRRQTGSQEQFLRYHRAHADRVSNRQITKSVPGHKSDDGASTERLDSGNVTFDLTVAYYLQEACGGEDQAHIDLSVNVDTSWTNNDGEPDEDNVALAWNDDHYRYEDGTAYSDNCSNCSLRNQELNGVSWDWGDGAACWAGCDADFAVGCYAELLTTDQERAIQAEYNHVWNSTSITGVGFSSAGAITVTVSEESNWEEIAYEIAEEPFEVADYC